MNDVLFLGPLIVPVRLLVLAVAALVGYAALRFRLYRSAADAKTRKRVLDPLGHAFFAGLIIWKFSPLLLDTRFVLEHPLSLLYFSGGRTGLLLAAVYAVLMLAYTTWKRKLAVLFFPDAVMTLLFAGGGAYSLMLLLLGGGWFAAVFAVLGFGLYYAQLRFKQPLGSRKSGNMMSAAIALSLIVVLVQNNLPSQDDYGDDTQRTTGVRIGHIAADFTLTALDGTTVQLSDYRGKRVLLNFWATWCPPCKAEMPHLEKFWQEAQQQGIVVLGINLTDTERSVDHVASFVTERDLTVPVVLDQGGYVRDLYRVRAYPTSFIVDSNGVIRGVYQGAIDYETMRKAVYAVR